MGAEGPDERLETLCGTCHGRESGAAWRALFRPQAAHCVMDRGSATYTLLCGSTEASSPGAQTRARAAV
jgi:hypothetical protein